MQKTPCKMPQICRSCEQAVTLDSLSFFKKFKTFFYNFQFWNPPRRWSYNFCIFWSFARREKESPPEVKWRLKICFDCLVTMQFFLLNCHVCYKWLLRVRMLNIWELAHLYLSAIISLPSLTNGYYFQAVHFHFFLELKWLITPQTQRHWNCIHWTRAMKISLTFQIWGAMIKCSKAISLYD